MEFIIMRNGKMVAKSDNGATVVGAIKLEGATPGKVAVWAANCVLHDEGIDNPITLEIEE